MKDMANVRKSVTDLAADGRAVRGSVMDIKIDLSRSDERLNHMPTKGFIFATSAGLLAAGSGLVALIVRFIPHV